MTEASVHTEQRDITGRLATSVGLTRIVFGAAFVVAPRQTAGPWVGAGVETAGARLLTRSMGVRDLLLGVGLLRSLSAHDNPAASQWLAYGSAAGLVDAAATAVAFRDLPRTGRAFLAFIVGALVVDGLLARKLSNH